MSNVVIKEPRPDKCANLVPGNKKTPFPHCDMRDGREGYCPFSENLFRQTWCRFYQRPRPTAPPPAPKPSIDKPYWNSKVIMEFVKGTKLDAGDILSLLGDVIELVDYNHRDPDRTEYKIKRSFQVVVREGK